MWARENLILKNSGLLSNLAMSVADGLLLYKIYKDRKMNIKSISPVALLALVFAFALTSCSPYEEGPGISFRSKASRIANTWTVNYAVEADGDDLTSEFSDDTYIFADDGGASITIVSAGTSFSGVGTWTLTNDDANWRLEYSYTALGFTIEVDESFEILRLANDEFWIRDTDDEQIEIHFVSANS